MGLHPDEAERLLRGASPEAVDDALRPLARLLAAARGPLPPPEPDRTADAVAAMAAAVVAGGDAPASSLGRPRRRLRVPITAAAMAGAVSLFGGLAAAGALPAPAQHTVANVLSKAGIDVPRGTSRAHPSSPGGQPPLATSHQGGPSSAGDATAHPAVVPTTVGPVVPSSAPPAALLAGATTTSTTEPPEANEPALESPAPAKGAPPGETHRPPDRGPDDTHSNRGHGGDGR